jgi:hypothetical protein
MALTCPKCSRTIPNDSVYCPYCGHGIQPSAKTPLVSAGGTLMIAAGVASFIALFLSIRALTQIYSWYPASVAQGWIVYDQLFTVSSFTGFLFGFAAGILSLIRRSYKWTIVSTMLCTLSGAGTWIISMIVPFANIWYSFFYYFLPMFTMPLTGTLLIYPRKAEFDATS